MASYDLIVIGAGPGGYVCAIKAAQLGLKTAVVEGRETLGGTCLNVGCIPSKALLHATHALHEAEHNFAKMGLKTDKPQVDWDQMLAYKRDSVGQNTSGIEFLFKKNKIDWLKGWGSVPEAGKVKVGEETHEAKNIVIASGSVPTSIPNVEIDNKIVVDSTGALELGRIPEKMVVIGAGVIGLELGSVYRRLGTEVTVVEYLDAITPGMDAEVARNFQKILTKQGLKFVLGSAVQGVSVEGEQATVTWKSRKDDSEESLTADCVLVATGRKPYVKGLGLEELGVEMTDRGQIKIDDHFKTSVDGVYAIGDAVPGLMLAHKAEDEGVAIAEILAGQKGHVNYEVIPGVVYTHPEVATVGKTEEQLKEAGHAYKVGKFPFLGNARAKANHSAEGFVKILADKETDRILGAHIIGPMAGDLIHEVCVAMEFGAAAEDLARTCHAHPTYSEAVREAALALGDGAIHA
ncbi:MAG: dihydrolipoamide dehydrogenase [Limimaricola cinnabarinus]|jgi:dihydrolipoamide dehydrogenase|uniref:Dihydrolipoyl dehydrogenase n=1 Tax=Limimaricola cinnabarinus LL-001 TaxID=1337093 RepID=U2Z0X4_9RHOB|nr:dihydrolipoyl dehydrogenase [Limimaricola cinnabarinus]GAD55015.1 dihydrolipoamide dehydrogenase of 2-oxoglutarate dehydrogenase [Limimaricola cinnabarinus LL-001]